MSSIEELTKLLLSGNINKQEQSDTEEFKYTKEYVDLLNKGDASNYYKAIIKLDVSIYKHINRLNILNIIIISLSKNKDKFKEDQFKFLIKETLKRWASPQDPNEINNIVGDLFSFIACPIKAIKDVVSCLPDITPIELLESQIVSNNGLGINLVHKRINLVFGDNTLNDSDILYLYKESLKNKDSTISRWIGGLVRKSKIKVPKPNWVDVEKDETSKLLDYDMWRNLDIKTEIIRPEEEINNMMTNFSMTDENGDIDQDLLNKVINAGYSAAPLETDNLYPCDIDRMFGPVNRKQSECISGVIGGGCRMLTCRCRDNNDELDNEANSTDPDGWFEGRCDGCDKIITNISYGVRFPVINGGWVGCFCSLKCMTDNAPRTIDNFTETILSNMVGTIESKGIIDREILITKQF